MRNQVSVPNNAWVVVADHSKALILVNNGTPMAPKLEIKQVIEAKENPPTRDQGTDRPGRAFIGSRRSAMEQTDWHAIASQRFMESVASAIDTALAAEAFEEIVLVAAAKALAELREAFSDRVREVVIGTLDKNLVHMPVDEIERHLAA